MSIQAVAWAIEQQEVKDPHSRLVLICLANYSGTSGRDAFPAVATLCRDSGLSESTVRRHLDQLLAAEMISLGNQAIATVKIARADRRPTVYDIDLSRGVTVIPRKVNGVSTEASRGVTETATGCQAMTPDPKRSEEEPKKGFSAYEDFREDYRKRFGKYPDKDLAKPIPQ